MAEATVSIGKVTWNPEEFPFKEITKYLIGYKGHVLEVTIFRQSNNPFIWSTSFTDIPTNNCLLRYNDFCPSFWSTFEAIEYLQERAWKNIKRYFLTSLDYYK